MLCSAVPLYQSELSPPGRRGRMVGSHGALLATGFVRCALYGHWLSGTNSSPCIGFGWLGRLWLLFCKRGPATVAPLAVSSG